MHEPRSIRGLPLATLAVIAAVATTASVARWVPAAAPLRDTGAVTGLPDGAPAHPAIAPPARPAIAPPERADAPTGNSHALRERADAPAASAHSDPPASARSEPPRLPPRVEAHARDAVDRYIAETGLEDAVSGVDREALVAALGQVRASSRWLSGHAQARGDAESRRRQALLDADRVFRDTLGVGIGEFVAALAPPGTIEDLGTARQ